MKKMAMMIMMKTTEIDYDCDDDDDDNDDGGDDDDDDVSSLLVQVCSCANSSKNLGLMTTQASLEILESIILNWWGWHRDHYRDHHVISTLHHMLWCRCHHCHHNRDVIS